MVCVEPVPPPRVSDDPVADLARFNPIVWPEWSVGEDNMASIESRL